MIKPMKRVGMFAVSLAAALVGIAIVAAWYLVSYQGGQGSLGGIMGQMMGNEGSTGMAYEMPAGVWVIIVVLAALAVIGAIGVGYYITFPEIKSGVAEPPAMPTGLTGGHEMSWDFLMRTSKPEEKRVLEVLAAHNGSYLQKFVVKEAGLSKLKIHRIVSKLAERKVVTVERSGNTNLVSLASWVRDEEVKAQGNSVSTGP